MEDRVEYHTNLEFGYGESDLILIDECDYFLLESP